MTKNQHTNEQKFFDALRDIFVGAEIEGDSGYINLMRMKSRYYLDGVFPKLQERVTEELEPFPNFREELFDKLYSFFKRYFSESGSIYFRSTPYYLDIYQNVYEPDIKTSGKSKYEQIYADDRDVILFWKTQMLYYVKTDRLFRPMTFGLSEAKGRKFSFDVSRLQSEKFNQRFSFDVSTLEHKRSSEKRQLVYAFKKVGDDGTIEFDVAYTEKGKKTKLDEIQKQLKKAGVTVVEDLLERAFRTFERQSQVDFFINKNAKAFLEEQFDLWTFQYLFKRDSHWTEQRIRELQSLKRIAFDIIEFISQFENELIKIWNKPKFAINSNYVITFDKIFQRDEDLARRLLQHEGFPAQVVEWRELALVDESFTSDQIFQDDLISEITKAEVTKAKVTKANKKVTSKAEKKAEKSLPFVSNDEDQQAAPNDPEFAEPLSSVSSRYRFLPVDTRHFKSLELGILALFDNLDDAIEGTLIHSENYQALNTIRKKFDRRIQSIYIDPPYNTNISEIDYENNFRNASWISLMENRLTAATDFLTDVGIICVTIDDYQVHELGILLDEVFERSNQLGLAVIRNNPSGRSTVKGFSITHEYAFFYGKTSAASLSRLPRSKKQFKRFTIENGVHVDWKNFRKDGGANTYKSKRPKQYYPLYIKLISKKIRIPSLSWDDTNKNWDVLEPPKADETVIYPIDEKNRDRIWSYQATSALKNLKDLKITVGKNGTVQVLRRHFPSAGVLPRSLFDKKTYAAREHGSAALAKLFGESGIFAFAKSPFAVKDCVWISGLDQPSCNYVLDFFAGSGTTAQAVLNLNRSDGGKRKYILVEASHYFYTVLLPRIKKLVFSNTWKDGKPVKSGKGTSHFLKYFAFEQYEDTLRRAVYLNDSVDRIDQPAFFDNPNESPFSTYVFLRDKKMLDSVKADYAANKIRVDFSQLYEGIDLAETLSHLKGKFIRRITDSTVEFMDGETVDFKNLDYRDILRLVWWDN